MKIKYTKLLEGYHARLKAAAGNPELIEKIKQTFKELRSANRKKPRNPLDTK